MSLPEISFASTPDKNTEALIFLTGDLPIEEKQLTHLDSVAREFVVSALAQKSGFKAKLGQSREIILPADGNTTRVIIVGTKMLDDEDGTDRSVDIGGHVYKAVKGAGLNQAALILNRQSAAFAANIATGFVLAGYKFSKYKSGKKDNDDAESTANAALTLVVKDVEASKAAFRFEDAANRGVYFARDLVNEPPNTLYPESFATIIKDELKPLGVTVEVLDEKKLEKLGAGAILAVGQGSIRPPRMVIMHWKGEGKGKKANSRPLAFVGKGVTFDTGGISIKPGANMDEMKMDMGGAAAVCGLMKAIALRHDPREVIGIVGLAENMPSHNAYRPGDIIGSMSGKTIEVLNTDAEGRLVLADCLTYVQKKYNPEKVIDLATLTGAIMVGLGLDYAGAFVNNNDLWKKMEDAAAATGEKLWRMPLDSSFRKEMESEVADLKNLGTNGRYGGACSAAGFLEHFIDKGREWSHIDIAGTAWAKSVKPYVPKGGTGYGVRLLCQLVEKL